MLLDKVVGTNDSGSHNIGRTLPDASRLVELDGLRGIAIVMVLVWHYVSGQVVVEAGSFPAYAMRLIGFMWMGVDLFFVLSGFLVGGLLLRCAERGEGVAGILIRRAFRIGPLYFVAVTFFWTVNAMAVHEDGAGWAWIFQNPMPFSSYLSMTQNFVMAAAGTHGAHGLGATWSLALEIQFYIALALMVIIVPRQWLAGVLVTGVLLAVLSRTIMTIGLPGGGFAAFLLPPTRFDSVAIGMLLAIMLRHDRWQRWVVDRSAVLWIGIAAMALIVVALNAKGHGIGSLGMNALGHLLFAMTSALTIALAVSGPNGWFRRFMRAQILVLLGTISYGIYLLHQPIAGFVHHLAFDAAPRITDAGDGFATICATILTIALARLSWHAFERPMVSYGRQLTTLVPVDKAIGRQ